MHPYEPAASGALLDLPGQERPCVSAAPRPGVPSQGGDLQPAHALQRSGDVADRRAGSVLWIDDEVEPGDPSVRLLASEGFHVDCAASGAAALGMALGGTYDAIILDLRLPDTSGLALLEHLRAGGVAAPVLVLTGFGDLESAVAAFRLGAVDFQRKPLMADELVAAVRAAATGGAGPAGTPSRWELPERLPADDREPEAAHALLGRLEAIARGAADRSVSRQNAVAVLMLAVENAAFSTFRFLASAGALRYALTAVETFDLAALIAQVRHATARAGARAASVHIKTRTAIAMLDAAMRSGVRPPEHALASELGVDPAHLGRLIRSQTGLGFRHWRRAFAIRRVVRELADPDAQIAQIAFRTGYEHPSQLDREFRGMFGITPREYRRLRKQLLQITR